MMTQRSWCKTLCDMLSARRVQRHATLHQHSIGDSCQLSNWPLVPLESLRWCAQLCQASRKNKTPSGVTCQELQTLLQRGIENFFMMKQRIMEVGRMWESVQDLNTVLIFSASSGWKNYLMIHLHLLKIEECRHCFKKAKAIFFLASAVYTIKADWEMNDVVFSSSCLQP